MDDDGDIQIVSFDKEKPPQFIPGNGQAGILPVPFQNNKLLDVIEKDSEEAEGYINELPPYSLVESIITSPTLTISTLPIETISAAITMRLSMIRHLAERS